jgi:hypothetical protein
VFPHILYRIHIRIIELRSSRGIFLVTSRGRGRGEVDMGEEKTEEDRNTGNKTKRTIFLPVVDHRREQKLVLRQGRNSTDG